MAKTKTPWMPVNEACVMLRLSRERVIRQIQRGEIEGQFRPGNSYGRWYVARRAVEQAIAARGSDGTQAA